MTALPERLIRITSWRAAILTICWGASYVVKKLNSCAISKPLLQQTDCSTRDIYDYLIVDEASQVDLATGVLAFSCARNIVIVGDLKQLPNVLTEDDIRTSDAIWQRYSLDERYRFSTHSLLSSALEIWQDAPVTLLREHYRCHPKIINFCNQKFYHGTLIVMTKDHDEPNVLAMYRTTAGNHARGHLNQRQIDVIQQEVLPRLHQQNFESIGIITPYRDQVTAIRRQLGRYLCGGHRP